MSKLDHGLPKGTTMEIVESDIAQFRRRLKIGDTVYYPREALDRNTPGLLAEHWERLYVVAMYPFLIEAIAPGRRYPRRTITYAEMIMNPRILEGV